jgi:large subunit ribosomal protein L18e
MKQKISKTEISKKTKKKTNSVLVETINLAKKNNLLELAKKLTRPTRMQAKINLEELGKEVKDGEKIIIPGKILGNGNIDKKITVIALAFSAGAKEKLKKAGCETKFLIKEIEENKTLKGIRII